LTAATSAAPAAAPPFFKIAIVAGKGLLDGTGGNVEALL
jgi:hypothetical protein